MAWQLHGLLHEALWCCGAGLCAFIEACESVVILGVGPEVILEVILEVTLEVILEVTLEVILEVRALVVLLRLALVLR